MNRTTFETAKNQRFAKEKRHISKAKRHVEWRGDEKIGTFGGGTCVSLVTGQIIKPAPKPTRKGAKNGRKRH